MPDTRMGLRSAPHSSGDRVFDLKQNRWGATDTGSLNQRKNGCRSVEHASDTRKVKTRGQGAGHTLTALTRPIPVLAEGSQAVQKPRSSLYATRGRPAVTQPAWPVAFSTVAVVA